MALIEANRDSYKAVIGDATKFLKQLQWDEGENVKPENDYYGGAGYNSASRPDLSNMQYMLDTLVAAGVPTNAHIETGFFADRLLHIAATANCSRVVLGCRGHSVLAGLVLGSVANQVLHLSPLPVTLVK